MMTSWTAGGCDLVPHDRRTLANRTIHDHFVFRRLQPVSTCRDVDGTDCPILTQ